MGVIFAKLQLKRNIKLTFNRVLSGVEKQYFKSEIIPTLSHDRPGLLSTANEGNDKNTSTVN